MKVNQLLTDVEGRAETPAVNRECHVMPVHVFHLRKDTGCEDLPTVRRTCFLAELSMLLAGVVYAVLKFRMVAIERA